MASCSKCGFVITTEYLAAHERLCGGKVKATAPNIEALCEHKQWKRVGDRGVVCAACGHIIIDGRRPEVIMLERIARLEQRVTELEKP